jgi:hypothetical protein
MRELFCEASVVVLPSYYEGFGFGLMHALALKKPVIARNIPATREILKTFRSSTGIYLFNHTAEVVPNIIAASEGGGSLVDDAAAIGWDAWVHGLVDFCNRLIASPDVYRKCVERIRFADVFREAREYRSLSSNSQPMPASASASAVLEVLPEQMEFVNLEQLVQMEGEAFVRAAYWKVLGRRCDPDGLASYAGKIREGASKRGILTELAGSAEGRRARLELESLCTNSTQAEAPRIRSIDDLLELDGEPFLQAAYITILGRPADEAGLAFYLHKLQRGVPKKTIAVDLAVSSEGKYAHTELAGLDQLVRRGALHRKLKQLIVKKV